MGESDHAIDALFYAINGSTGKMKPLGKGISITEFLKLAPGGLINKNETILTGGHSFECVVKLKTITKKRFIKLLMARGIQRNDAIRKQKEYIKRYKNYNKLAMEVFLSIEEMTQFILKIGDEKIENEM